MILAVVLIACSGTAAPEPAPAPVPEVVPEPAPDGIHGHMQEHVDAITTARDALISGDVDAARGRMTWLAGHKPPPDVLPEGWSTWVGRLQDAAKAGAKGADARTVAAAVASTGRACGGCHAAFSAGPSLPGEPMPGDDAHMQRHRWASDRMWEGILTDDRERWTAGAFALVEPPLAHLETSEPDVAALAKRVHELGRDGMERMDADARAALYGELLGTCATCHTKTDGGPG